ncbi:MAG: type I-A CRISPR-associated protein Cas7/Csa2 [Desulfurococcales archaeon ex4484_58]|nr:MAG: type I-A CRISPR-associated protein Cas7/Csa2 [Desulfurococcales archaeon ex4484_58]
MSNIFFSFRGRVVINVEALNMVESIGNYVKHRRVPVIVPEKYVTYMVPAISGETIAHGYQVVLAEKALENNLPVCKLCSKGIFLKSTNIDVFNYSFGSTLPNNEFDFEKTIISKCVVEDIGGFLYAAEKRGVKVKNLKRTSNFYVGYMVPVAEALSNVVVEPQLHSRYALGTQFVSREEREARGQMIYYVELSSAPYTFSFDLDTKYIGKTTFTVDKAGTPVVSEEEIKKRKIVALEAFADLLIENMFGAKKTRFLPVVEWESFVVAVSDGVWTVPSPFTNKYIDNALKKKEKIDRNTKLYIYRRNGEKSFEEVLLEAIEDAKKRIMGQ